MWVCVGLGWERGRELRGAVAMSWERPVWDERDILMKIIIVKKNKYLNKIECIINDLMYVFLKSNYVK